MGFNCPFWMTGGYMFSAFVSKIEPTPQWQDLSSWVKAPWVKVYTQWHQSQVDTVLWSLFIKLLVIQVPKTDKSLLIGYSHLPYDDFW